MRTLPLILLLCTVAGVTSCKGGLLPSSHAGESSEAKPSASADEAAQRGLQTMQALVTEQNFAGLGFESADQIRQAHLEQPMPIFSVGLEALKSYKTDSPGQDLLTPVHRTIFPVSAGGRVLSSLSVSQREDGWRATDFGNAALARALSAQRQSAYDFAVWVPALKIYFTGREPGAGTAAPTPAQGLTLTPIMDDPRVGLKAGEALPASRVFVLLQRLAAGVRTDAPL